MPMHFDQRMSDADALMWAVEKDPLLRSTITGLTVFDAAPDRDRLLDKIDRGTRLIPRMRQKVMSAPLVGAPPRWVYDEHFDLQYHVRWTAAPGAGTMRDLLDATQPVAMQGFDRARPLWEMVVVEGLEGGGAAIVQKLHHAITDGVGGMQMAMALVDLARDTPPDSSPMPEAPEPEHWSGPALFLDAIGHERRRQAGIMQRAFASIPGLLSSPSSTGSVVRENLGSLGRMLAPSSEAASPLLRARSLSNRFEVFTAPMDATKAAAKAAGGKLNDAFVAAVLGAWRRWHDHHGQSVDALRMTMPINIRNADTKHVAGNQFAPARFTVPLDVDDPIERMQAIQALVAVQRGEPALNLTGRVAGILNRLPDSLTIGLFGSMLKGIDFVTSNVPGSPIPLYTAGAAMTALYPFGPLGGAAANLTLVSYQDQLQIGVNLDPAAVADSAFFLDCLKAGFDEVLAVA